MNYKIDTFNFKWLLLSLSLCSFILGLFLIIPIDKTETIFPSPNTNYELAMYSDSTFDSGKSLGKVLATKATELKFEYELIPDYQWPYAAMTMKFVDKDKKQLCQNWSSYSALEVTQRASKAKGIYMRVNMSLPKNNDTQEDSLRLAQQGVTIQHFSQKEIVQLNDFVLPYWYKAKHKLSLLDNKKYFKDVCSIDWVAIDGLSGINIKDTLTIQKITLKGKSESFPLLGSFTLFVALGLMLLPLFKPGSVGLQSIKTDPVALQLVDTNIQLKESIEKSYSEHYSNPDLSSEAMAKIIGLHPRKLASLTKEFWGVNHRQMLNNFRLIEASRLLKETQNPVGEIAFKVGFSNIPHFNRTFKAEFELSPLQFRKEKQA
ncbi:AraC family transcriptional regulator [bacterium]|nr:AraC family transcriptional regulator [bacterium]